MTIEELVISLGINGALLVVILVGGKAAGRLLAQIGHELVTELRELRRCSLRQSIHLIRLEAKCHGKLDDETERDLEELLGDLREELARTRAGNAA